jgi:methionyl aminopeptidase
MTIGLSRNDTCWCGSGRKYKRCHLAADQDPKRLGRSIVLKTPEQLAGIRAACQLTKEVLDHVERQIRAGVTTDQINDWVHTYTLAHGGTPATLHYRGFPKSTCTSINDVICHGIPDATVLKAGDIINVDVTTKLNGYFGDASRMFCLGQVSPLAARLVQVARECLALGLEQVRPGRTLGDLGWHIQRHAEAAGFSVVRAFTGHGIGLRFHEPPEVLHVGEPGQGPVLQPGMVFTIEPMINAGGYECRVLKDGWTAVTKDGSLSAQWEHTVCCTAAGVDVLTA